MSRKEAIQKIKELLSFRFEEVAAVVETPVEVVTDDVKEEVVTEEVKLADTTIDIQALQTEIADLRTKVQVLQDVVQLKDQFEYLKKAYDQMQAGFTAMQEANIKTLELVEQIADEPTAVPAQTPKDGLVSKKSKLEKYFAQ